LHEEVQNLILQIDDIVQASIHASFQCSEIMPNLGAAVEGLPQDVEILDTKLETVEGALGRDARAVGASKEVINADAHDALRVFRAVENLKLPAQFHYSSIGGGGGFNVSGGGEEEGSTDLLPYFQKKEAGLERELAEYQRVVVEVESHLRTVEGSAIEGIQKVVRRRHMMNGNGNGGNGQVDVRKEGLRELAGTMRGFEEAVLRVAGRVGEAREGVVELGMGGLGRN
jgi:nucleoporin p58/p45